MSSVLHWLAPCEGHQPCAAAYFQAWNHPHVRAADKFPGAKLRIFCSEAGIEVSLSDGSDDAKIDEVLMIDPL